MNSAASVEGRDRLRLFCALQLPEPTLAELVFWQRETLGCVPDVRLLGPEQLHVTVAFLGGRPAGEREPIAAALRAAATAARPPTLSVRRYRETRSVGMVVLDDEEGLAGEFALDLFGRLEALGVYERERRPWLPHVTVIRFRRGPRLDPALPLLAPFSPSEAALYHSVLRPTGAQYDVLDAVALGGG